MRERSERVIGRRRRRKRRAIDGRCDLWQGGVARQRRRRRLYVYVELKLVHRRYRRNVVVHERRVVCGVARQRSGGTIDRRGAGGHVHGKVVGRLGDLTRHGHRLRRTRLHRLTLVSARTQEFDVTLGVIAWLQLFEPSVEYVQWFFRWCYVWIIKIIF